MDQSVLNTGVIRIGDRRATQTVEVKNEPEIARKRINLCDAQP